MVNSDKRLKNYGKRSAKSWWQMRYEEGNQF